MKEKRPKRKKRGAKATKVTQRRVMLHKILHIYAERERES